MIIEGASDRQKIGYTRPNAVELAVHDLRSPLTSGTMTTLVAFLPMMFLPGVMGRFLSYIPTTVFTTLVAALFLSLTIALPLFEKLAKKRTDYIPDPSYEATLDAQEKAFLEQERADKTAVSHETISKREEILGRISHKYSHLLGSFLESRTTRLLTIFLPFIALIFTFIVLSPRI